MSSQAEKSVPFSERAMTGVHIFLPPRMKSSMDFDASLAVISPTKTITARYARKTPKTLLMIPPLYGAQLADYSTGHMTDENASFLHVIHPCSIAVNRPELRSTVPSFPDFRVPTAGRPGHDGLSAAAVEAISS
jgi:hypothetical protein